MEHALRVISVERGYDPREFTLFSYGGAGGLHATELARALMIPNIIISPFASVLSAFGMLAADTVLDYVQTVMLSNSYSKKQIDQRFRPLIRQGKNDLLLQGVELTNIILQLFIDARYQGQSHELTIPYGPDWDCEFHKAHKQAYDFQSPGSPIELVNIRVKAIGLSPHPVPLSRSKGSKNPINALIGYRDIMTSTRTYSIPCYQHELLEPGNMINGPALVVRSDTTIVIKSKDIIRVDSLNNLLIRVG